MRTFLCKNGLMNNSFVSLGLDGAAAGGELSRLARGSSSPRVEADPSSHCCWRRVASLDRATLEAGRNLGASRLRILIELALPQVMPTAARSTRALLRDDALGAVGADDGAGRSDHADRRLAFRINAYATLHGQCARRHHLFDQRRGCDPLHQARHGEGERAMSRVASAARRAAAVLLAAFCVCVIGPLANLARGRWPSAGTRRTSCRHLRHPLLGAGLPPDRRLPWPRSDLGLDAMLRSSVALALSVPAGYALARLKLPMRSLFMIVFLLPQAFPSVAIYINVARIFYNLGINGTILGVVLVHAAHGLVYSVWIAAAAFAASTRISNSRPGTSAPRHCAPSSR